MINLFETFNNDTKVLIESLRLAGHKHPSIVIDENGYLPEYVTSPYQFFAGLDHYENDKAVYFNELEVPYYWEIDGNNQEASIKDMNNVRGKIFYPVGAEHRVVSRVEWLDESGRVRSIDHYHQFGFKYATTVKDLNGASIMKIYYDRDGNEIIYENFITNDYIVQYQGQEYFFNNKVAFIQFYLNTAFEILDSFIINSLSIPFIVVYQLNTSGDDYLFWQENISDDIPGNMKVMLDAAHRHFSVVIPDSSEFSRVQSVVSEEHKNRIIELGYLYKYLREVTHNKEVLILTNSDQIESIEYIIQQLPDHTFNIAAVTEMSPKLMDLSKYSNVKLYPSVKREVVLDLYRRSSVYLDINYGNEILSSVRGAFDYQMLILGFEETVHNRNYTAVENIYSKTTVDELIQLIKETADDVEVYRERLSLQKAKANEIDKKKFKSIFI